MIVFTIEGNEGIQFLRVSRESNRKVSGNPKRKNEQREFRKVPIEFL